MEVSIIIPTFNQLEYTKMCIDSIRKNTLSHDYEVIVVDNGSKDGSVGYLRNLNIILIENGKNMGVAKAWNKGVKKASGEYVCIINNDIIVCDGWTDKLIAQYTDRSGIVSPGTREGELDYDFDMYSRDYIKKMSFIRQEGFSGWCMMIKKSRFEKVGLFSEEFRVGIGEDTDFYLKLKKAGFKSHISGSSFVHHFGSKTIKAYKEKKGNEFERENIAKLSGKWGSFEPGYPAKKWKSLKKTVIKGLTGHSLVEK